MNVFDDLAVAYDNTIDWKSRLEREMPLILSSFSQKEGRRALDIACGSGRHAVALAKEGFEVSAFDSSPSMIAAAKDLAKEQDVGVSFRVGDMLSLHELYNSSFDLAICLGNSLALLPSFSKFETMVSYVHDLLYPEGTFIFQVLNFEAIESQGIRFMPVRTGHLHTGEEVTFSRFLDHTQGDPEKANLVLSAIIESEDAKPIVKTQEVLRLTYDIVQGAIKKAGFSMFDVFSDYFSKPFQKEYDRNIVVRARK